MTARGPLSGKETATSENVSRMQRGSKVPVANLPSALTVLCLILVPVFVVLGLQSASWTALWAVFVVFTVATITGRFNGKLACSWGQIIDFGRTIDPTVDKALALYNFALLSYQGYLSWQVTILIAVRELGIVAMRAFFLRRDVVISANQTGKLKTFMRTVASDALLIPWAHSEHIGDDSEWQVVLLTRLGQTFTGVALVLTLYSGFMYIVNDMRLIRGASADEAVGDSHDNDAPEELAPSRRSTAGQYLRS